MSINVSRLASITLIALFGASTLAPAASLAAETRKPAATPSTFCTRLAAGTVEKRLTSEIDGKTSNFIKRRTKKDKQRTANKTKTSTNLKSVRSQWDSHRADQFAKLTTKATTEAQKQAVTEFIATTKTAIATRRTAVDAAMTAFQTGIDKAIAAHRTGIDAATAAFKAATAAAITKAKADCAAKVDPVTVRENFTATMKAARDKYQTDRKNTVSVGETVSALTKVRRAAVDKAFADFHTTMQAAHAKLKAAFKTT